MLRRALLVCLTLGAAVLASAAMAQERHALVIGIDAYDNLDAMQKAVNDGRAMADSLERAGFTVDAGFDLDRRGFLQLLTRFLDRLEPEDEALVFYAGHAVAIDRANYLVPSDATALDQSSEAQIIAESIGQAFLLDQITATGVRLTVVIMDACRNNPFDGVTRSVGRDAGLSITQPPRGVFMMFSADVGQVALDRLGDDDPNPNSLFTRTLLPLIEEPGLDIVDVARRLRGEVQALAASVNYAQFPVYRDRMQGDGRFSVRPAVAAEPAPVEIDISGPAPDEETPSEIEIDITGTEPEDEPRPAQETVLIRILPAGAPPEQQEPEPQGEVLIRIPPQGGPRLEGRGLIEALQSELNRHNCGAGPVDGAFGMRSASAVRVYNARRPEGVAPLPELANVGRDATTAFESDARVALDLLRQQDTALCGATAPPDGFDRDVAQGCFYERPTDAVPLRMASWSGSCDANGFASGRGRMVYIYPEPVPDRVMDVFEGALCGGLECGEGRLTFRDGSRYVGEFDGGRADGQGAFFRADGSARYDGQWCSARPCGFGVGTFRGSSTTPTGRYVGTWQRGDRHGQGVFTYDDGTRITGDFREGFPVGEVRSVSPDGRAFCSYFSGGTWDAQRC